MDQQVETLNHILNSFNIKANCFQYQKCNHFGFYKLILLPGGKISHLEKYTREITLLLKNISPLIIKTSSKEGIIEIQTTENQPQNIDFFNSLSQLSKPSGILPFYFGQATDGSPIWSDMIKNPHLLIAGTTGSGKSNLIKLIINNALLFPALNVFLLDTKNIDFSNINGVNTINKHNNIIAFLEYLLQEIDTRFNFIKQNKLPANYFENDNQNTTKGLVIIDEFADLIFQDEEKKLTNLLVRITQQSRAAGIYFVLATQRASADIISGAIKANFPARIACKTSSKIDSRIILDANGAELLSYPGDCIIKTQDYNYQRFQAALA